MDYPLSLMMVALIASFGFYQWLRYQRRALIHRERLAALEKGMDLPSLEREGWRNHANVQRLLLLAGLVWISIGIGIFVLLTAVIRNGSGIPMPGIDLVQPGVQPVPNGLQWVGLAPVLIGVSHLIVYYVGRNKER